MRERRLTWEQLERLDPCQREKRRDLYLRRRSVSVREAFAIKVRLKDMIWVAWGLGLNKELAEFAKQCVERISTETGWEAKCARENAWGAQELASRWSNTKFVPNMFSDTYYAANYSARAVSYRYVNEYNWQVGCFIRIFEFESEST